MKIKHLTSLKKAQIAGEIFVFILAAVLAILIIAYGYRAIAGFTARTNEIALAELTTKLQSEIRTISSSHDVKRIDLRLPGKYEKICLIDFSRYSPDSCLCRQGCVDYNPIICDAWGTEGYEYNVFLIPIEPIKVSRIEIEEGYICLKPERNKVSLRLEGLGDRAKVSEWV